MSEHRVPLLRFDRTVVTEEEQAVLTGVLLTVLARRPEAPSPRRKAVPLARWSRPERDAVYVGARTWRATATL